MTVLSDLVQLLSHAYDPPCLMGKQSLDAIVEGIRMNI